MALKLGFVGVGGIAKRHLTSSDKRDDVEIVGHADVSLDLAKAAAEQWGGSAHESAAALFDAEKPDAIVICTPPFAHGDIEEAAAQRGIHFFVEKPVAVNLELAKRVKDAVDAAGVLVQVGYMYRYAKGVQKVKELLSTRKIAMVQQHYYMPGMPGKGWWPKIELSGGQLIEQATHMLDMGRFLAGEVASVVGCTSQVHDWTPKPGGEPGTGLVSEYPGVTIPDTTALIMRFESGAMSTLSCSMVPQVKWDNGFRIVAEGLFAAIDGGNATWQDEDGAGSEPAGKGWADYVLYDFLDAVIEGRRETFVPYDEGIKSLAISLAGYASVEQGGAPVDPRQLVKDAGIDLG